MADVVRIFGLGRAAALGGLAGCAIVALAGVWAAVLWHRLGDVRLAVNLCGVAGLLASPVSWLHHFVWVVPLAVCLAERRRGATRIAPRLPGWFLALGWVFVGWVAAAPFRRLPNGADVELRLDLVAAPAGLGHRDPRGGLDHRRHRGRPDITACRGDGLLDSSGLRVDEPDHHGRPPQ